VGDKPAALVSLIFLQTYIRGLVGWELPKGTTFPYKKINFVPRTHVLIQILVNFDGNFFSTKGEGWPFYFFTNTCGWGVKLAGMGVFLIQSGRFLVVQKFIYLNLGLNI